MAKRDFTIFSASIVNGLMTKSRRPTASWPEVPSGSQSRQLQGRGSLQGSLHAEAYEVLNSTLVEAQAYDQYVATPVSIRRPVWVGRPVPGVLRCVRRHLRRGLVAVVLVVMNIHRGADLRYNLEVTSRQAAFGTGNEDSHPDHGGR